MKNGPVWMELTKRTLISPSLPSYCLMLETYIFLNILELWGEDSLGQQELYFESPKKGVDLNGPSYKSLLITLIMVQWWKEGHFSLLFGEIGTLHVLWTCLKNWAFKVKGLEEHFTWFIMHEIGAEFSDLSGAHFFWQVPGVAFDIWDVRWALVSET